MALEAPVGWIDGWDFDAGAVTSEHAVSDIVTSASESTARERRDMRNLRA
jgi:hypothetical protein